ncbi:LAFA_0D07096g1_1 [Lachancea sp. 'fantastica']|nr:LAFA_0D07096g1_1 [Lachancea sp. 'fantastica']
MEKFTNWRDKGTGIAPFVPTPPPLLQEKGLTGALNNVKFVLKAICVLPLVILALVSPCWISKIIWSSILKIMVSWSSQLTTQGVKKRDQRGELPSADSGIYLANCSSPFDAVALWLLAQGPTAFCVPLTNGKTSRIVQLTFWQFVKFALNNGQLSGDESNFQQVTTVSQLKGHVVYFFAEGTTSNGKSVLPFELNQEAWDDFLGLKNTGVGSSSSYSGNNRSTDANVKVHTIHLKINSSLTTPLRLDKWKYLVRASTQGVSYKCKIVKSVGTDLSKVRAALVGGDKFRLVGKELNTDSKRKFIKEFASRRR